MFSIMTRKQVMINAVLITFLGIIANFPFRGSEDIMAARETLLSTEPKDFWGSFSSWFFSLAPQNSWELTYGFIFSLMLGFSSVLLLWPWNAQIQSAKKLDFAFFFLMYVSAVFVTSFSRDGAMLVFIWLAFGIWRSANFRIAIYERSLLRVLSTLLLVIGFSFRPWLAFTIPIVLLILSKDTPKLRRKTIAVLIIGIPVSLTPILIERAAHSYLGVMKSFPEQQVMIMDYSSIACLSSNKEESNLALRDLELLSNTKPLTKSKICSQYYPASWASVTAYGVNSPAMSPIKTIKTTEEPLYIAFRHHWIDYIMSHPQTYIQTKIFLASQLIFAGDSPKISYKSIREILRLPYEFTRLFRLYSILPTLLILYFSLRGVRGSDISGHYPLILLFYLFSVTLVVFAFIGDNQRYLVPFSIISFYFTLLSRQKEHL